MTFEIIGPFRKHYVQVNGHQVPHLEAWREPGTPGKVWLSVRQPDARHTGGRGRPHHRVPRRRNRLGDGLISAHPRADMDAPIRRTPFPKMVAINSVTTDTDILDSLDPDNEPLE